MTETKSTAATGGATVTVKGKKFTLAKKLPFRFLRAAQDENLSEIISILLGDEQADVFWGVGSRHQGRHRCGRQDGREGRGVPGGILSLTEYLSDDTWDAVEADFQRFYRLDLCREADTAGLRRLYVLIRHLPSEAALWAVMEKATKASSLDELDAFFGRAKSE